MRALGYGPTQLDELVEQGKLPKPIHLSENSRAIGWFEDEIIAHQEAMAAARDREAAKEQENLKVGITKEVQRNSVA
jgi:predicted DNA-binding transcriptional regulator AlpA